MISLKGITWDHPRGYSPLNASIQRYRELFGVEVSWEKRTLKDFGDISIHELAKRYDLLVIDHPHMGSVHESSCLVNLEEHLSKEDLYLFDALSVGPSFQSYHYNNHLYALPVDAACQTAAYRSDLIGDRLLPSSWADVIELSNNLKAQNNWIAVALRATDCNCIFLTLCAQTGNPVAQNAELLIPVDTGIYVLKLMKTLKNIAHPESLNWNPIQLYNYMTHADEVLYSPLAFAYINYAKDSPTPLRYTNIPGTKNAILGGAGMAVSAHSKCINEGIHYTRWICDPRYQETFYVEEGGQPAQLNAWTNEQADKKAGGFFSSVLPVIKEAYVRPQWAFWPAFQEWMGEQIHQYLRDDSDPAVLIDRLNEEYKKRIQQNGNSI